MKGTAGRIILYVVVVWMDDVVEGWVAGWLELRLWEAGKEGLGCGGGFMIGVWHCGVRDCGGGSGSH